MVNARRQGQRSGRWSVSLRAERAVRDGKLTRWARRVAVVALAWKEPVRQSAARSRLDAIAHRVSHALLAWK
ncbi:hypothetical protein GCM10020367_07060 [Streptomyces sannanensis]|uniref:Transposase n=1 Tax=Streptomyces sannanensis TaxID=285536 RepID=A0ABP6S552_9ACTN